MRNTRKKNPKLQRNKLIVFICLLAAIFMLSATPKKIQGKKSPPAAKPTQQKAVLNPKEAVLNVGIGLGSYRYYSGLSGDGYTYRSTPFLNLSCDVPLAEKTGPGYITIGGALGYQHASYRYDNVNYNGGHYYYTHKWNDVVVAARGAYHPDIFNSPTYDAYAGLAFGLRFQQYSYDTNSPDPNRNLYRLNSTAIGPSLSVFAGVRWFFMTNVGLYLEAGYGITYLNSGLCFKL